MTERTPAYLYLGAYDVPTLKIQFKSIPELVTKGCHAFVWLPEGDAPVEGWPVALIIHGGGFTFNGALGIASSQVNYLVKRGIACVSVEYRLLPHYHLDDIYEDCVDSIKWITSGKMNEVIAGKGKVDGSNMAVFGHSAGGHLSAMMGHFHPPMKACFLVYGLFDQIATDSKGREACNKAIMARPEAEQQMIRELLAGPGTTDNPDMPIPETGMTGLHAWGWSAMMSGSLFAQMLPEGVPLNEETRKRYSPYHLADRNFPPTFLATGDADDVVAPSQSHRFAEKLKELGVEAHVAEAKGANHSYDMYERNAWSSRAEEWWTDSIVPGLAFLVSKLKPEAVSA